MNMINKIEKITEKTRELVNNFFVQNWYSTDMSVRGKIIDGTKLDGFLLQDDNEIIGLGTYKFYGDVCEIVTFDSKRENIGIGTAILKLIEQVAIENNCTKMRLITTNDNLRALQFYQKRGYSLTKIYQNEMDEVRKVKPNVPIIGENGIPLRDELELEKEFLLEADPDKDVVNQYIEKGEMYIIKTKDKALAEIFITEVDNETCELKNIATLQEAWGQGLASILIKYVFNEYKTRYKKMIVGTTENMIPFYVLNGFTKYYKTEKKFFINNYSEEVWDGNLHCIDMYYYSKEL